MRRGKTSFIILKESQIYYEIILRYENKLSNTESVLIFSI